MKLFNTYNMHIVIYIAI